MLIGDEHSVLQAFPAEQDARKSIEYDRTLLEMHALALTESSANDLWMSSKPCCNIIDYVSTCKVE